MTVSQCGDSNEKVVAFPSRLLWEFGYFQGMTWDLEKYYPLVGDRRLQHRVEKSAAERDPTFKQIVSYVMLIHGTRVFTYRLGEGVPSSGTHAVGVGGHVSDVDDGDASRPSYSEAARREIDEEVDIGQGVAQPRLVGFVNDDSDHIGRCHFAALHVLRLDRPYVGVRDATILEPRFCGAAHLRQRVHRFQNWSRICIAHLERLVAAASEG
jgi:predicted NUDIX family phosphoesterase